MTAKPSWPRRIGWMAAMWLSGVAALAAVAGLLRLLMTAVGLTVR